MPRGTTKPPADNGEERGVAASLPQPDTAIDDRFTARRTKQLLDEALELKLRHDRDKKRLEEITDELLVTVRGYELPGVRNAQIAFLYRGDRTNKFLDKGKLLEHGVSPEVIADSYKDTKPFPDARLIPLKRP